MKTSLYQTENIMINPITPPPELMRQWRTEWYENDTSSSYGHWLAARVVQWCWHQREPEIQAAADAELEACVQTLEDQGWHNVAADLRAARRPKPPSLKEQALIHFESHAATFETAGGDSDLIRRALESIDG